MFLKYFVCIWAIILIKTKALGQWSVLPTLERFSVTDRVACAGRLLIFVPHVLSQTTGLTERRKGSMYANTLYYCLALSVVSESLKKACVFYSCSCSNTLQCCCCKGNTGMTTIEPGTWLLFLLSHRKASFWSWVF